MSSTKKKETPGLTDDIVDWQQYMAMNFASANTPGRSPSKSSMNSPTLNSPAMTSESLSKLTRDEVLSLVQKLQKERKQLKASAREVARRVALMQQEVNEKDARIQELEKTISSERSVAEELANYRDICAEQTLKITNLTEQLVSVRDARLEELTLQREREKQEEEKYETLLKESQELAQEAEFHSLTSQNLLRTLHQTEDELVQENALRLSIQTEFIACMSPKADSQGAKTPKTPAVEEKSTTVEDLPQSESESEAEDAESRPGSYWAQRVDSLQALLEEKDRVIAMQSASAEQYTRILNQKDSDIALLQRSMQLLSAKQWSSQKNILADDE